MSPFEGDPVDPEDEALVAQHRDYLDSFKVQAWDGSCFKARREALLKHLVLTLEQQTEAMREEMANDYIASTRSKAEYEAFVQRYSAGVAKYAEDWTHWRDTQLAAIEYEALVDKLRHEATQQEVPYWPYDPHRGVAGEDPGTLEVLSPETGEENDGL